MKVLAIIYNSPAHLDFGGHLYNRTLLQHLNKGDQVDIIISERPTKNGNNINRKNLEFNIINNNRKILLSGNINYSSEVKESIKWLSILLSSDDYDFYYIDRICTYSQVAFVKNDIFNYIAMGTGGGAWGKKYRIMYGKHVLTKTKKNNYNIIKASKEFGIDIGTLSKSFWVQSQYRNIHSLPDIWYEKNKKTKIKKVINERQPPEKRKKILITYGNSMSIDIINLIIDEINFFSEKTKNHEIKFLTGTEKLKTHTEKRLINKKVKVSIWGDYEKEFSDSFIVIGHGGISHIYNCIKYSAIPCCFPCVADQFYNSERVKELSIGFSFFKYRNFNHILIGKNAISHYKHGVFHKIFTKDNLSVKLKNLIMLKQESK